MRLLDSGPWLLVIFGWFTKLSPPGVRASRKIKIAGPHLEDEASQVYQVFWK